MRIQICMTEENLLALRELAMREHRDVRQQVEWIIEQELIRLKFRNVSNLNQTPVNKMSSQDSEG